jgi:hypothetical protein
VYIYIYIYVYKYIQVGTPFRLLSSIIIAWKQYTYRILIIKNEIFTLQKEKNDIAIAEKNKKERKVVQIEKEIMELKVLFFFVFFSRF